jgi:uncharacterized protein YbaP (TraB family)
MVTGLRRIRSFCGRRTEESGRGNRRQRGLLAPLALLTLASPGTAAAPAYSAPIGASPVASSPALWVVSDHDTIIYLFGTVHTHDGKSRWFANAVKNAFDGSGELVLETIVPSTSRSINAAVAGRTPGVAASPDSAGLSGARTAIASARTAGMSVDKGADAVLSRAAAATGKPVEGLESFEFQLSMYDSLPGPAPTAAPRSAAASDPRITAFMQRLMAAWDRGDPRTFESVIGTLRTQSPEAYRVLFQQRNATWASWIAGRLREPGTVFVAVGTGHLVGQDSVQAKLADLGIASARVN